MTRDLTERALLGALVTVSDLLLTEIESRALMERMVQVAADTLTGVDSASVTVQEGASAGTIAATDKVALSLDEAQYRADDGPCLTGLRTGNEVHGSEVAWRAWPEFAVAAKQEGVQSSLSVPMRKGGHVGVLNLYSARPDAFDDEAFREAARIFARYAATIVAANDRYLRANGEVGQLHEALDSRAVIEQAKGMIMLRERCGPDEAFERLVSTSQRSHRKLRDIAATLVATVTGSPAGGLIAAVDIQPVRRVTHQ